TSRSRYQSNLDVTPCKFAMAETPAELGPSTPPRARPSPSDAPERAFCRSSSRPSSSPAWRSSSAVKLMIGLSDDIVERRIKPGVYRSVSIAGRFLAAAMRGLSTRRRSLLPDVRDGSPAGAAPEPDLSAVRGQAQAKRVLGVAAAGGHNVLVTGPLRAGNLMLLCDRHHWLIHEGDWQLAKVERGRLLAIPPSGTH